MDGLQVFPDPQFVKNCYEKISQTGDGATRGDL